MRATPASGRCQNQPEDPSEGMLMLRQFACAILLSSIAPAQAAGFLVLDDLSGVLDAGFGYGQGGDELVISGWATPPGDNMRPNAYRWTARNGIEYTGTLRDGSYSRGIAVSNNGSTVVGEDCCGSEGFKWSQSTGITRFGGLGTSGESVAYDVSANGSTIVGMSGKPPGGGGGYVAVRWTADGGMVALGHLAGLEYTSAAQGVSPDGSSVVGVSTAGPSGGRAFLWTELAGMTDLGDLPGGISSSSAWAVSNNGVAIGKSYSAAGREAFRWTSDGGMEGLGFLPGSTSSEAVAISADGSVIGGQSLYVANSAFLWTETGGMQRLFDVLVGLGVSGLTDWNLYGIKAISPDGQWIVGIGGDPDGQERAFVANISPVPVPAAAWLFAGALGLLGVVRRRACGVGGAVPYY